MKSKKTRESAKKYMETEEDEGVTTYLDLRSPLGLISFNAKPSLRQYVQCEFFS